MGLEGEDGVNRAQKGLSAAPRRTHYYRSLFQRRVLFVTTPCGILLHCVGRLSMAFDTRNPTSWHARLAERAAIRLN